MLYQIILKEEKKRQKKGGGIKKLPVGQGIRSSHIIHLFFFFQKDQSKISRGNNFGLDPSRERRVDCPGGRPRDLVRFSCPKREGKDGRENDNIQTANIGI